MAPVFNREFIPAFSPLLIFHPAITAGNKVLCDNIYNWLTVIL